MVVVRRRGRPPPKKTDLPDLPVLGDVVVDDYGDDDVPVLKARATQERKNPLSRLAVSVGWWTSTMEVTKWAYRRLIKVLHR